MIRCILGFVCHPDSTVHRAAAVVAPYTLRLLFLCTLPASSSSEVVARLAGGHVATNTRFLGGAGALI
jgi:predicted Na+-dependent transporter